jgi:hypothetical protein
MPSIKYQGIQIMICGLYKDRDLLNDVKEKLA